MIRLKYRLETEDHVAFQLYVASCSKRIKRKRKMVKIGAPIAYLILAAIAFFVEVIGLGIIFALLAILWYFFYPKYEKKRYEKHYRSFVEENLKADSNPEVVIELTDTYISLTNKNGYSSMKIEAIKEIDEISKYFFIRFNSGQGLVLPKSIIGNMNEFEKWLNLIIEKHKIKRNINLEWKWK